MKVNAVDRVNLKTNIFNKNIFEFAPFKKIQEPLIEDDIIFLQNKFLENGFYNLKVQDIETGRSIITKVLHSLNYYNDIALLSSQNKVQEDYYNITKVLIDEYDINNNQINLINFFLDKFYFDFLIIELTRELSSSSWVCNFEQNIFDFNFHKTLPIIIVTYENM